MKEQEKEKLSVRLSSFLNQVSSSSDFSQVTELYEFQRIECDLVREEDKDKLFERAFQVFMKLTRPISLSDLFSWASFFPLRSMAEETVSKELIKLLSKELLEIKNARDIIEWHFDIGATFASWKIRGLLEKRLLELFNEISPENIPEWLESMLSRENSVFKMMPESCLKPFIETAERLQRDFSQQQTSD